MPYAEVEGSYISSTVFQMDHPVAPFNEVRDRLDDTMAKAESMLEMLVGEDGQSGFLGDLNTAITSAPVVDVPVPDVDTEYTLETSGQLVPVFDPLALAEYPTDTYPNPTIAALPTVDTAFDPLQEPEDIDPTLSYSETAPSTAVYTPLLAKMLVYLQDGYTGIDPIAEQALYDRARNRQQATRVAEWNKINDNALAMQFALPSGVLLSAQTDFAIGATRQDADINNQIIVEQADREQKHQQWILQQANVLEDLIRKFADLRSARALDAAKAQVSSVLQDFSERVKRYVSVWEGRKTAVMAQVEVLRGVIEGNKGAVETFKAQYDALKTRSDAVTAQNKGLIDVYLGEVQGFGEAEKAVASRNESAIKLITARIAAAELEVRAAIADSEALISGYSAEGNLRQKVSADLANITAQTVASLVSAVNVSANWGYSAGESTSASYNMGVSLSESHQVEHDPIA